MWVTKCPASLPPHGLWGEALGSSPLIPRWPPLVTKPRLQGLVKIQFINLNPDLVERSLLRLKTLLSIIT